VRSWCSRNGLRRLRYAAGRLTPIALGRQTQAAARFRCWRAVCAGVAVAARQRDAGKRRGLAERGPEHRLILALPLDAVLMEAHQVQPIPADRLTVAEPDPFRRFEQQPAVAGDAHLIALAQLLAGEMLPGIGQQVEPLVDRVKEVPVAAGRPISRSALCGGRRFSRRGSAAFNRRTLRRLGQQLEGRERLLTAHRTRRSGRRVPPPAIDAAALVLGGRQERLAVGPAQLQMVERAVPAHAHEHARLPGLGGQDAGRQLGVAGEDDLPAVAGAGALHPGVIFRQAQRAERLGHRRKIRAVVEIQVTPAVHAADEADAGDLDPRAVAARVALPGQAAHRVERLPLRRELLPPVRRPLQVRVAADRRDVGAPGMVLEGDVAQLHGVSLLTPAPEDAVQPLRVRSPGCRPRSGLPGCDSATRPAVERTLGRRGHLPRGRRVDVAQSPVEQPAPVAIERLNPLPGGRAEDHAGQCAVRFDRRDAFAQRAHGQGVVRFRCRCLASAAWLSQRDPQVIRGVAMVHHLYLQPACALQDARPGRQSQRLGRCTAKRACQDQTLSAAWTSGSGASGRLGSVIGS